MTLRCTRRGFLATGAAAAIAIHSRRAVAQASLADANARANALFDPRSASQLKQLAAAALETAKGAGAVYADVRFRFAQQETWGIFEGTSPPTPSQHFIVGVGVRALIRGYWGLAASDGIPTLDTMAQLGRDAAAQAAINAQGPARHAELALAPVTAHGEWTMPAVTDPFTVSYDEKTDFLTSVIHYVTKQSYGLSLTASFSFVKEMRAFASSDGAFTSQTVYASAGGLAVETPDDVVTGQPGGRGFDFFNSAGGGWEYVLGLPFEERAGTVIDEALRQRRTKPVEIGRYDIVFDANTIAAILDRTIGAGTELDRAMGYLAAEGGSSFLDDPLAMLGVYQLGSPLVTVTASRAIPGGGATVKWDEEGVEPTDVPLVTNGMLTDFQTTRESASWIAPYYQKVGRPVRSSGASGADEATAFPRVWPSNFILAPDRAHDASFDDLVANVKKGYAVKGASASCDFQCLNGTVSRGVVYEIVNGKLGSAVAGAQPMFRAPEFWKNIAALGGPKSVELVGPRWGREPRMRRPFATPARIGNSVQAVPALVTGVAVADLTRKG